MHDTFGSHTVSYPCSQCGLCCRHVDRSHETAWLDRGDGTCRHFDTAAKHCTVYAQRPQICRIDELYPRFSHTMSRAAYYQANAAVCNALQATHGLPSHYQIHLGES